MQGLHLTADLYDCQCESSLLLQAPALAQLCWTLTQAAGLSVVGEKWHSFPAAPPAPEGQTSGVTGMLLLAESHVALHTWPELGQVTLDVYVCNFSEDNTAQAEGLMQSLVAAFAPGQSVLHRLERGQRPGTSRA